MSRYKSKHLIFVGIFLLFSFICLFICIYYYSFRTPMNKDSLDMAVPPSTIIPSASPLPTTLPTPIYYTNYYVPVTGFKELKNNITTDELNNSEIFVTNSEKDEIGKLFRNFKIKSIDDSQFIDEVANSNSIGLVPWYNLDPKLKVLSIDNQYFFDKTIDYSKYPLKVSDYNKSNFSNYTDLDTQRIHNVLGMGEIIPARTADKFMRLKNDYLYPFRSVKSFLDKYDSRIATFESALIGNGNGNVCALNCFTFIGNERFIEGMKYSGINLVSLANNHSMNGGIDGIGNTIKLLNSANIQTVGASTTNNDDATKPGIIQIGNTKIGVLGYNDIPSVNDWATDTKGGTARIDTNEYKILPDEVKKDVTRAKDAGAQFVIVIIHWGAREYTNDPLDHQKALAHYMIENGVDMVLGDHPHWTMSVEFYKPNGSSQSKFIDYGIGNFIFDQDWSVETSQGTFVELNFYDNKILSIKIHPHQIVMTQPRLLDESTSQYKQIFNRIWQFTPRI